MTWRSLAKFFMAYHSSIILNEPPSMATKSLTWFPTEWNESFVAWNPKNPLPAARASKNRFLPVSVMGGASRPETGLVSTPEG